MDALTQVVHGSQVLFPQGVQRLQHYAFLKVAHHFNAHNFFFTLINFNSLLENTFAQGFFMQFWLFIQPLFDWHFQIKVILQTLLQTFDIPHFFQRLRWNIGIKHGFKDVFTNAGNGFANVAYVQQFVTLGVDRTALVIGHIIIFQQLLTNIKVTAFNFTLRIGNGFSDPRMLDGFAWFHPQFTHHAGNAVRSEDTHQGIFHRQVEARRTSITLTARTATQLVIDTA